MPITFSGGGSSSGGGGGGVTAFSRLSAHALTRVTTTPAALGEYRCMFRSANNVTTGTDCAPTISPNSTDGFYLNPTGMISIGNADFPARYVFFLGVGKEVYVEGYKTTGFGGHVVMETNEWRYAEGSVFDSRPTGPSITFNSSTGLLVVDCLWTTYYYDGNHLFFYVSPDSGTTDIQLGCYFDVFYR